LGGKIGRKNWEEKIITFVKKDAPLAQKILEVIKWGEL
jgi:hypothetical protein